MAGWITILGECPDFSLRLERFRKIFNIDGIPPLNIRVVDHGPEFRLIQWAWGTEFSDIAWVGDMESPGLLISGVITELTGKSSSVAVSAPSAEMLFAEWQLCGEEVVPRLNGSFSTLFHDPSLREVHVHVDRFASRSVWVQREGNTWLLGNFPSAVAACRSNRPSLDPAGLWALLHMGRPPGNRGLYAAMFALMAGQKATLKPGQPPRLETWWSRRYVPDEKPSPREWGEAIAGVLQQSADRLRRTCIQPRLFLSGGLDSRLAAAAFGSGLHSLTLCTQSNLESRLAQRVADTLDLEHSTLYRTPYWYLDTSVASALISSGNYLNHHTHFIVPAMELLTGTEPGEFLLGDLLENFNKHYFSEQLTCFGPTSGRISEWLPSIIPATVREFTRQDIHLRPEMRQRVREDYDETMSQFARAVETVSTNPADRLDTLLRWANVGLTYTYNMHTCLWPLARTRNLYFDHGVDNLSLQIPATIRGAGILHAHTLRRLNKRLSWISDANTLQPPIFPETLKRFAGRSRPVLGKIRRAVARRKNDGPVLSTSGSWLLLHEMYRKDDKYRAHCEAILFNPAALPEEIFTAQAIRSTWHEYLSGNVSRHFEVEALLSFGRLNQQISTSGLG